MSKKGQVEIALSEIEGLREDIERIERTADELKANICAALEKIHRVEVGIGALET